MPLRPRLLCDLVLTLTLVLGAAGSVRAKPSDYTQTRFPIVLVHGASGFDKILGSYEYFYGIVKALQDGGATVFVVHLSPYNSNEERGEQLIEQLDDIAAITGVKRFNLIGHSQGGTTIRYAAAVRPDLVASVTSVSGPQGPVPLADMLAASKEFTSPEMLALFNASGDAITLLSGHDDPNDAMATLQGFTTAGMSRYNAAYPAGLPSEPCGQGKAIENGIYYYSWGGAAVETNSLDFSDYALAASAALLHGVASDGVLPVCITHLGEVIRDDYPQNHGDSVNQFFGLIGAYGPRPDAIFRAHANRLKNAGL